MGLYSPDVIWHLKNTAKLKVKVTQSCPTLCPTHGLYNPWNSPGQNTGVDSHSVLQGNLPNPGIEPRSPALQADSLPAEPQGKAFFFFFFFYLSVYIFWWHINDNMFLSLPSILNFITYPLLLFLLVWLKLYVFL